MLNLTVDERGSPVTNYVGLSCIADLHQVFGKFSVVFNAGVERLRKSVLRIRKTCESPFIACLESARIRLKEGSYLQLRFGGWALPFPRTGCAPRAGISLVPYSNKASSLKISDGPGKFCWFWNPYLFSDTIVPYGYLRTRSQSNSGSREFAQVDHSLPGWQHRTNHGMVRATWIYIRVLSAGLRHTTPR